MVLGEATLGGEGTLQFAWLLGVIAPAVRLAPCARARCALLRFATPLVTNAATRVPEVW